MSEEKKEVSLSMAFGKFNISVQSTNWMHTIAAISEGIVKSRIIGLIERNIVYESEIAGWFLFIPESLSGIKERISLALLLAYPNRVTRSLLSTLSSVKAGSLANYLTKDELEVLPHIDENKEGIVLNPLGCSWGLQMLDSIENKGDDLTDE